MHCIPVPELAERTHPDAEKLVIAPPNGDLTNDECRSADVLVEKTKFMGKETGIFRAYFAFDEDDIDRLAINGGVVEFHLIGTGIQPFGARVL